MFNRFKLRHVYVSSFVLVVSIASTAFTATSSAATPLTGPLVSAIGSKCADARSGVYDGAPVTLWTCNNTRASQNWLMPGDGTLRLTNNYCLSAKNGSTGIRTTSAIMTVATCNGTTAQKWGASTSGTLKNVRGDYCVEVRDGKSADGTMIWQSRCYPGGLFQTWRLPNTPLYNYDVNSRVFTGNFDTGNVSQWLQCQSVYQNARCSTYQNNHYSLQVQTAVKRQGSHAARFELRDGDVPSFGGGERTEVNGANFSVAGNKEYWYQWSTMFDPTFQDDMATQGWSLTDQWHDLSNSSPPIGFYTDVADGQWGLRINRQSSPGVWVSNKVIWSTSLSKGTWQDLKVHIKWSTDPTIGFVELWHNGVLQTFTGGDCIGATRCYTQTLTPGGGDAVYFKQGLYRSAAVSGTSIVYKDGFAMANTEAGLGDPTNN